MPQEGLTVKVAGRVFPMRGAMLDTEKGALVLKLSSGPAACKSGAASSDVKLKIGLEPRLGDAKLPVFMAGDVFKADRNTMQDPATVKVESKAPLKDNASKEPLTFGIQAAFKVSDYTVEVRGQVKALNCQ